METRYFLVNLLCVFIPLFGLEIWRSHGRQSYKSSSWTRYLLAMTILVSSTLCTFFNFSISSHMNVNLSIVALSMGFFLLSWPMGLLILAMYSVGQLVIAIDLMSDGHPSLQVVKTVLIALPTSLVVISVFALIMTVCSIATQNRTFPARASGFVLCLMLYTLIDFTYVQHMDPSQHFKFTPFVAFMLVFNFTFLVAVRLMIGIQDTYKKRLDDIRLEKFELISQLAASVAHEIKNPITVVRGYAQLMQKENYDTVKTQAFLQTMVEELDRAQSVITDYLHLAKDPINNTISEINLSVIVEHVVDVLRPYGVNHNVELKSTAQENLFIYGNPTHVTQAIVNLVKNAVEAHDNGGIVKVCLKQSNETVTLKVTDSGKGIPKSMINKLGEPYLSTKKEGTGLGLTLVFKVINDVRGKIEVQSEEGAGTTFSIVIPRVAKTTSNQNINPGPPLTEMTPNRNNSDSDKNNLQNTPKRIVWSICSIKQHRAPKITVNVKTC